MCADLRISLGRAQLAAGSGAGRALRRQRGAPPAATSGRSPRRPGSRGAAEVARRLGRAPAALARAARGFGGRRLPGAGASRCTRIAFEAQASALGDVGAAGARHRRCAMMLGVKGAARSGTVVAARGRRWPRARLSPPALAADFLGRGAPARGAGARGELRRTRRPPGGDPAGAERDARRRPAGVGGDRAVLVPRPAGWTSRRARRIMLAGPSVRPRIVQSGDPWRRGRTLCRSPQPPSRASREADQQRERRVAGAGLGRDTGPHARPRRSSAPRGAGAGRSSSAGLRRPRIRRLRRRLRGDDLEERGWEPSVRAFVRPPRGARLQLHERLDQAVHRDPRRAAGAAGSASTPANAPRLAIAQGEQRTAGRRTAARRPSRWRGPDLAADSWTSARGARTRSRHGSRPGHPPGSTMSPLSISRRRAGSRIPSCRRQHRRPALPMIPPQLAMDALDALRARGAGARGRGGLRSQACSRASFSMGLAELRSA